MKINVKRVIALALSSFMMVSVAGCTSGKDKKMGRYLEERFQLPEKVQAQDMKEMEDGSLILTAYNSEWQLSSYVSTDNGANWIETKIEVPKVDGKEVQPGQSTILADGKLLVSYYVTEPMVFEPVAGDGTGAVPDKNEIIPDKGEYLPPEMIYRVIDESGASTEVKLDFEKEEAPDEGYFGEASRFKVATNGDLFFVSPMGTAIIQLDTETWKEIRKYQTVNYVESYALVDNSMITWSYDGIIEYDIESGEEKGNLASLEKETIKSNNANYPQLINAVTKEKLYYYSVVGLYSYDLKTKENKMLIDGALSYFGNRESSLMSFMQNKEGDFLTLFSDWGTGESAMIRYYYDANVPTEPDEKVRVYSLIENDIIRQAISQFSKENPDIYVKYEVGLSMGNGITEADALKTLNTEIMAGNGPDVILLDNLPAESYIEKGLLEDISDIISESSSKDEIFKGMEDAYKVDGKIYQFPTSFKMPMIIGEKEVINKITDLRSLANLVKELGSKSDRRIFADGVGPRGFVYSLYYLYGNDWLNADNTINEEALTNFLTLTKDIYTINAEKQEIYWQKMQEQLKQEGVDKFPGDKFPGGGIEDDMEINPEDIPDKGGDFVEDPNMNLYELSYSLVPYAYAESFLWEQDPAQLVFGGVQDSWGYGSLISVLLNKPEMDYKVLTRGEENILAPLDVVGVNAKSKNKDVAKKFVKEMLSNKSQSTGWRQGMQVNKTALLKGFEIQKDENFTPEFDEKTNHYIMGKSGTQLPNGEEKMVNIYFPNEDDVKRLTGELEKLNVAPKMNKTLLIEVAKQFEACINKETTVDEAVKTIVNNLDLYLSE